MKKVPPMKSTRVIGAALTAAAMFLPSSRSALADAAPEKGIVAFKYLNYRDSQPEIERMDINAYTLRVMTPIAGKWAIDVTGTLDSITGASPHYHTHFDTTTSASGPAGRLKPDTRRSVDLSVTRYFSTASVTGGTSYSEESDYISRSVSLQGSLSTPSKNTTVTLGGSVTTDSINPNNLDESYSKKTYAALIGVTQVMSKNDIIQVNLSRSVGKGYFSDPYKTLDERPKHRNYSTLMGRWNHYFDSSEGVLKLSYRYYDDTYGINSHTIGAEYVQPLPMGFTIMPSVRYYSQNAAKFYVPVGPIEADDPTDPASSVPVDSVIYSLDQRLSAFGAVTLGLKVSRKFAHDWLVDVRYDYYMQRYDWGINGKGDSYLDEFNAGYLQIGLSKEF
jgi:hypothetical protein